MTQPTTCPTCGGRIGPPMGRKPSTLDAIRAHFPPGVEVTAEEVATALDITPSAARAALSRIGAARVDALLPARVGRPSVVWRLPQEQEEPKP